MSAFSAECKLWHRFDDAVFPTVPDNSLYVNTGTMTNQEAGDLQGDVPCP